MPTLLAAVVFFAGVIAAPPPSAATCHQGSASVILSVNSGEPSDDFCAVGASSAAAITLISIEVLNAFEFRKVRFSLATPPGVDILGINWNYAATGDLATGVEVDLGTCHEGPTTLGTLVVSNPLFPQPVSCAETQFGPHPSFGALEAVDCDGNITGASGAQQWITTDTQNTVCGCGSVHNCLSLPAYNLLPADGTNNVATDVTLSWDASPLVATSPRVWIATDPDCSDYQFFDPVDPNSFTPGFLQDNTTYYWQVNHVGHPCSYITEVHSFTTAATVPTEEASWGRIKALFD